MQQRSSRRDPDHRLRISVQPVDRPPCSGASGILPDRAAGYRHRQNPGTPAGGHYPVRRARLGLRKACTAGGYGDLPSRNPDPWNLLRSPVHGGCAGRPRDPLGQAGVRLCRAERPETGERRSRRHRKKDALLDEPRRPDRQIAEGFCEYGMDRKHRDGRRRRCETPVLRSPVPPGGGPHPGGEEDAGELPLRRLPLREELDDERLRSRRRFGNPGDGRRQARDSRSLGGRRLVGCGSSASPGDRPPAHLRLRRQRSSPTPRGRKNPRPLRQAFSNGHPFRPGSEGLPRRPSGDNGPGEEAEDHRTDFHRGFR